MLGSVVNPLKDSFPVHARVGNESIKGLKKSIKGFKLIHAWIETGPLKDSYPVHAWFNDEPIKGFQQI